jgi:F-type H+-transporting ATPase subunit delta
MSVAKTYAQALYEAAKESNKGDFAGLCDELETQMAQILKAVESSKELGILLFSPIVSGKERGTLIQELVKKASLNPTLGQFFSLLSRKGRMSLLPEIKEAFTAVRLNAEGGLYGRVVSAEAMSDEDVKGLAAAFGKKFGKKIAFRVSTDPSLLAGVKVTVNGVTYDGTLRSHLQRLRDGLLQTTMN